MNYFPSRYGALALALAAGFALGQQPGGSHSRSAFLSSAAAQNTDAAIALSQSQPAAPDQKSTVEMPHTDTKGRQLAPHDTFYMLAYVSAKTDKGVEGFEPGQEVHLVEVHRSTRTLVVSNGRAEVEVSPSKLTNDMTIAALVRQKDEAKQVQIAAYIQAEDAAYAKFERMAADATAKDIEHAEQEKVVESTTAPAPGAQPTATPLPQVASSVGSTVGGNGYYGSGGYGYGSPYSYLTVVTTGNAKAQAPVAAPAKAAAAPVSNVAAPSSHAGGRPR